MIPLTTRDAADWSMICAYLRLDDEGRKRVIEEIECQTSGTFPLLLDVVTLQRR